MADALELYLADEAQTECLGALLAEAVVAPALLFLHGELGAGKTTLSRGFIRACGHNGPVKSPTYTLIEPYALVQRRVFHLDLYRLSAPEELDYLGLDDLLAEQAILLVEWAERGSAHLPRADLEITLHHRSQGRQAVLHAHSQRAAAWLAGVASHYPAKSHLQD